MTDANDKTDAGSIRAARRKAGLSQERLARSADCSTVYIRLLERGYLPQHGDVLPRVLKVLESYREGAAAS